MIFWGTSLLHHVFVQLPLHFVHLSLHLFYDSFVLNLLFEQVLLLSELLLKVFLFRDQVFLELFLLGHLFQHLLHVLTQ